MLGRGGLIRLIFVVQEHLAKRSGLHYDLRLQLEGILKSWVLKKEPPVAIGVKRLAIPVEDHVLSWADFEGTIAEGYGSGTVITWDKGHLEWIEIYKKMKFELRGEKLKGVFVLVPFRGNFLFFRQS